MGGAFVAVANDSSATWWNPGALAAGPFLDLALGHATDTTFFTLGTPPFGFSYYRLRVTDIRPLDPTEIGGTGRQERRAGEPDDSLSASQLGITLVHTLVDGVHAGTTLKYARGGGDGTFDLDIGLLAVVGPMKVGGVVRNVREGDIGGGGLQRQSRVGVAYDAEAAGRAPWTVALDADVLRYDAGDGARRMVAAGAERWLRARQVGIRAGARVNTAGDGELTATAGASYAVRAGMYVDGHVALGDEDGWGIAARVSF